MLKHLYLPISKETVEVLLSEELTESDLYASLSASETAALLVINQLPSLHANQTPLPKIEKQLAGVINTVNEYAQHSSTSFQFVIRDKLVIEQIQQGLQLSNEMQIELLPQHDVQLREYLDENGYWDSRYSLKKNTAESEQPYEFYSDRGEKVTLLNTQYRLFNEFKTDIEEPLHVEGYAGTGKTHLLSAFVELLLDKHVKPNNILALAARFEQVKALQRRLNVPVATATFGQLASDSVLVEYGKPHLRRLKAKNRQRVAFSPEKYATELSLPYIGIYPPASVASCINHTLSNFCMSDSDAVDESHLPNWAELERQEDRDFIVNQAYGMLELTINPPASAPLAMPLFDLHIIKYVSLQDWCLPAQYTHIILDESHDISPALAKILNRSPQSVISLGDRFQRVSGRPGVRNNVIRQRNITKSIRVPHSLSQIVNAVLDVHPMTVHDEFKGNKDKKTEIYYYQKAKVPDIPVAIWVQDHWELFEWVQRLAGEGKAYRLIGSMPALSRFVHDCHKLYSQNVPSRHFSLVNYKSWQGAWYKNKDNRAFRQITKTFENGYTDKDWEKTKSMHSEQASYVVGLYEDSRNNEFNAVMLAPSIIERVTAFTSKKANIKSKKALSELSSKLYLGTTRTKQKLYAPVELRDFIEEIS